MSNKKSNHQKQADDPMEVAWYAACVEGWITTRLEHDKSLLTLSSGGIGLLITLKATVGFHSEWSFVAFILAIVAFVVCVIVVLFIFDRNSKHLEEVVKTGKAHDTLLASFDRLAFSAFLVGVVLSCTVGFATTVHSLDKTKGLDMADRNNTPVKVGSRMIGDSVNGIHGMSPGKVLKKSLNEIANMAPASQGTAQSQSVKSQPAKVSSSAPAAPGGRNSK